MQTSGVDFALSINEIFKQKSYLFTMSTQSTSPSLLILDSVSERGENVVKYLQASAITASFSETSYKNLLVLLDQYRPSALMVIADQFQEILREQVVLIQETVSLPIIVQLQSEKEGDVERFLSAGANVYLAGEVNHKRLASVYQTALTRHKLDNQKSERILQLEKMLDERKLIEKAKGLLMQYKGATEQEAFKHMRSSAMSQNKTMSELSKVIISALKAA